MKSHNLIWIVLLAASMIATACGNASTTEKPAQAKAGVSSFPCDKSSYAVFGIQRQEVFCSASLIYGNDNQIPASQAAIKFINNRREMVYDVNYQIIGNRVEYRIWGGYSDNKSIEIPRCFSLEQDGSIHPMSFGGSFPLNDLDAKVVKAYCNGQGFAIEMSANR